MRERSSGAVGAQIGLVSPRVVDRSRNHAREKDPIMRHRIVDTTDKQSFISKTTRIIIMRIQGLSHMFSISLLVKMTLDAVAGLAATFAQVGVDQPAGRMLTS